MRRHSLLCAGAFSVALALMYACGSSSHPPPAAEGDSGISRSDGQGGDGDPSFDAPATQSDAPVGKIPTVDEPDTPCVQAGGTRVIVFSRADTGNNAPAISRMQPLGSGRFGAGDLVQGFATFDPLGQNGKAYDLNPGQWSAYASEGTTVGAILGNGGTVSYQRYDGSGALVGAAATLQSGVVPAPSVVWIGSGGGGSLGVWETGKTLYAGGVTTAGASAGPAWQLSNDGNSASVSITYANGKYAILWSVEPTSQTSVTRFALADATGMSGAPVEITSGSLQFKVVKIIPTPNGFAATLLGAGGDNHVYVLPLDGTGKVSGPAHRLLGADSPWDMALFGNELGIVTSGNDIIIDGSEGPRKPLFRPLDLTGHPLGPWVCLDDAVPTDRAQEMAILAEANGYAVVYRSPQSDTDLVRFNHLGTGAP